MEWVSCKMRWLWLGLLVTACGTSGGQKMEKIGNKDLVVLMNDSDVQIVDVRTPEEVSFGRIAGARHIDFYDDKFVSRIERLDKEKPVVVYCAVGGRSARAALKLKELGFLEIYDLEGGMRGWLKEGNPIEK